MVFFGLAREWNKNTSTSHEKSHFNFLDYSAGGDGVGMRRAVCDYRTTITPTPVVPPMATSVGATLSPTATPTTIPAPTSTPKPTLINPFDDEVGKELYEDSNGLFSIPIPANWTAESRNGYGILTAPDGDLTFYVLAAQGTDVESAIADAWAVVDPEFDLAPRDVIEQPANGGLERFVVIPDNTEGESRVDLAIAQLYQVTVYAKLGKGRSSLSSNANPRLT